MQKLIVSNSIADRLRRFPARVELVDENGSLFRILERVDPHELPEHLELSGDEIRQTLQDIVHSA